MFFIYNDYVPITSKYRGFFSEGIIKPGYLLTYAILNWIPIHAAQTIVYFFNIAIERIKWVLSKVSYFVLFIQQIPHTEIACLWEEKYWKYNKIYYIVYIQPKAAYFSSTEVLRGTIQTFQSPNLGFSAFARRGLGPHLPKIVAINCSHIHLIEAPCE